MTALHWPRQPKSRLSQHGTVPLGVMTDAKPLPVRAKRIGAVGTHSDTLGSLVGSRLRIV